MPTDRLMNGGLTNLVLDEQLDTLNGGGSGLRDGGGNTTHCELVSIAQWNHWCRFFSAVG